MYPNLMKRKADKKKYKADKADKTFNFKISFFSKSNENCFHVMFKSVFTSNFQVASSVRCIHCY